MTPKTRLFSFFLAPKFSMMSLVSMIEPLRAANEIAEQTLYDCQLIGLSDSVPSINGMITATESLGPDTEKPDAMIICASYEPETSITPRLVNWLRRLDASGTALGTADTGAFILAKAGLLKGHRTTLHWINMDSFRERYPFIDVSPNLFEYSTQRFSCAGATTGMDLVLHILEQHHGEQLASRVANHFIRSSTRAEQQHMSAELARTKGLHPKVRTVIENMERHCERPLSIAQHALEARLSIRQLENLFKRDIGDTPARYYQRSRLHRARNVLRQSDMPVMEVGLACGFASRTQFSNAYKNTYGHPPSAERKVGRISII